jgi:hypothetical protein
MSIICGRDTASNGWDKRPEDMVANGGHNFIHFPGRRGMKPDLEWLARLSDLVCRWRGGNFGDGTYAALYFLHWQAATCGRRFASRKFKGDPRPDGPGWFREIEQAPVGCLSPILIRYFERYQFLGVSPNVSAALCAWLRGQWPLILCERIPTPEEVLRMQTEGRRPVTIFSDSSRMLRPVLHKPNGVAFMVHDLEHAYRFFHDPELHAGQRRFFAVLQEVIDRGLIEKYRGDPMFLDQFHYLISDMNTHLMHSLHFFRAILIEFHLRREQKPHDDRLSQAARAEVAELVQWLAARLGLGGVPFREGLIRSLGPTFAWIF